MAGPVSGLIIEVPESEPAVGQLRMRLDPSAALGVPAHVTVLFPFVDPELIDARVLERVAAVARTSRPFDYGFSTTGWFDDRVLFLAPDDPAPFRDITAWLWGAFPSCPPYVGRFDEVVPHLTIADGARLDAMLEAERLLRSDLPIVGRAAQLSLMAQAPDGRWSHRARWTLGQR